MEEKDVQRLLDMLYSMIDEAKSAAFSSDKCVISRDEALDLLDVSGQAPLESRRRRSWCWAREEYVSSAKKEVEKMLRQAELDAKVIVSRARPCSRPAARVRGHSSGPRNAARRLYHVANTYTEDARAGRRRPIGRLLDEVKESVSGSGPPPTSRCRPIRRSCGSGDPPRSNPRATRMLDEIFG